MNLMLLYGYRSKNGKIEIDPEEAAIVKRVFSEYLRGDGGPTVAKRLAGGRGARAGTAENGRPRRYGKCS